MLDSIFVALGFLEDIIWGYLGFPALMILGLYFSFRSGFVQIRYFQTVVRTFISFISIKDQKGRGVHPLQAFFANVGGCVGIGNVVSICMAVQLGGPGALFWIWITALIGMIIKYAEVYLGIRYRVPNNQGGYDGGPMYFLKAAFSWKWVGSLAALLLCVYGVEILQFNLIIQSVSLNWSISPYLITPVLLALVIFASSGGVRRVGSISAVIIPVFVVLYLGMGFWVILMNFDKLPAVIANVFGSAFSGHAAVGGFIGSTLLLTISQGVRRGCYTGDIAVGYASVINSETSIQVPEKQASLEFLGIALDTFFICTTSVMLILITDVWHQPIEVGLLVQTALGQYFPYMHFFMPFFLFLLGYSTINAYFLTGLKCAKYLHPQLGPKIFYVYAIVSFVLFSFVDALHAQTVMAIAGGLLLLINSAGIFALRHEVSFNLSEDEPKPEAALPIAQHE